jgi:RHH-type proline utilization regulon transcriptional repressor/proline dehydrogenase/delta 1-pyrroline-5-carboxylate dehydrogenase
VAEAPAADLPRESPVETELREVGRSLAAAFPSRARHPVRALDAKAMELSSQDAELRAALFRLVDVTPATRSLDDLARHLSAYMEDVEEQPQPLRVAMRMAETAPGRRALGAAAAAGVRHMAHRFIVAPTPREARSALRDLWNEGAASSLDLLGEATVTEAEADRYAERCADALDELAAAVAGWPENALLERDSAGPVPRANLSVKVSALTPLLRPDAPEVGRDDAAARLRPLLVRARDRGAHVHIDMESLDALETTVELVFELLAEEEFAHGPSVGLVLQAYLRDSPAQLERILAFAGEVRRSPPLVVRLVKGAYWDHEVVEARQHGWRPPVFERKADCDRNFEELTRRLLDARPLVRVAVGSHNLRSVAHAIAYNRSTGAGDADLELQVLRGLGDDLQHALASSGLRVRAYCPVGELVAGMAYLVRRLLENTSNESFLHEQARGVSVDELLQPPPP